MMVMINGYQYSNLYILLPKCNGVNKFDVFVYTWQNKHGGYYTCMSRIRNKTTPLLKTNIKLDSNTCEQSKQLYINRTRYEHNTSFIAKTNEKKILTTNCKGTNTRHIFKSHS